MDRFTARGFDKQQTQPLMHKALSVSLRVQRYEKKLDYTNLRAGM